MCKKNKEKLKRELKYCKKKPKKTKIRLNLKAYSVFFLMLVILCTPLILALDFDNKASYNLARNEITIKNNFGLGSEIAVYKLIESKDSIINAYATGTVTIKEDGLIFDKLQFFDRADKEQALRYDLYYYIDDLAEIKEPIYKDQCEVKGENKSLICTTIIERYNSNFVIQEKPVRYNYETLKAGTYKWRIEAQKSKANQQIDWIFTSNGVKLDKWAWWSTSWNKKKKIDIILENLIK